MGTNVSAILGTCSWVVGINYSSHNGGTNCNTVAKGGRVTNHRVSARRRSSTSWWAIWQFVVPSLQSPCHRTMRKEGNLAKWKPKKKPRIGDSLYFLIVFIYIYIYHPFLVKLGLPHFGTNANESQTWSKPISRWSFFRFLSIALRWLWGSLYFPSCFHHFPKTKNYFASSDPHHDISKQLVDTTFVWSFCHGTFAQLTIPIICFTWQVIVHVSLSNRI